MKEQIVKILKMLLVIGFVIAVFAVQIYSDELEVSIDNASEEQLIPWIVVIVAASLGIIIWTVTKGISAYKSRIQEDTIARMKQAELDPNEDVDSKILYLRPFHVDNTKIRPIEYDGVTYRTMESLLCAFMKKYGMPIAIGKPQERLQPLGAARTYASDDEWKDVVRGYLEEASYVILYVDFTPGVKWEIENVLNGYLDKLILVPKLFNVRAGKFEAFFTYDVMIIFYPLYKLLHKSWIFRRIRRGWRYYRMWDKEMSQVMPKKCVDDRSTAVRFKNGKPIVYRAKDATIEKQFTAIARAVKDAMGEEKKTEYWVKDAED